MKGREKSDGRIVPQDLRKKVPSTDERRGKATTASKQVEQLKLFCETADSPYGDVARADVGRPSSARSAVPKSQTMDRNALPAMTMEEVSNHGNLIRAWRQVWKNKGAPGTDGQSLGYVRKHIDRLIPELRAELLAGTYRPGMIRRVWIPKPGGGQRGLGIPNVVERIVQQAVYQILSPHYERTFHPSSHGFRPGRSCHTAIAEAKKYVEEGCEWVVDLDLDKFFDRVNHDRLLSRLENKVHDHRLLRLIRFMVKAKVVMPNGVVVDTVEGTPQGGPLSPLLSNIVLDELDRELEQRGHHFVRYADDCNIYVRSERSGKRVMESICRFIEKRLRLKVNTAKSAVAKSEQRHFVGFSLYREPHDGNVEVLLSTRTIEHLDRRIVELTPRNWGNSLAACIQKVNEYVLGWVQFFHICTEAAKRPLRKRDAHIRRRLRAIVLKHWKRKRTMVKRLIKLGVARRTASRCIYRNSRSLWTLSHCPAVDRGLCNAYFAKHGLVSLESAWERLLHRHIAVVPSQLELSLV